MNNEDLVICDDSQTIWDEVYTKVYKGKILGNVFDLESNAYSSYRERIVARTCLEELGEAEVSGETDFNFSEKPGMYNFSKFNAIKKIIEQIDDDQEKDKAIRLLKECKEKTYSPENFSLMLCNGSLQMVKGCITLFDRIDTFLYLLDNYYKGIDEMVLSHCVPEYLLILRRYLSLFKDQENYQNSVYRYCQEIYHISDKRFIDEMISMGKRNLDSDNVIPYMEMAKKFWAMKAKYFSSLNINAD